MGRKRLISIILTLSMIMCIMPFMPSAARAAVDQAKLNSEGTVNAVLNMGTGGGDIITISGEGKIDRDKWIDMVVSFNMGKKSADLSGFEYPSWYSKDTKKTTLKIKNNKTKLPDNSDSLFLKFGGKIELPEDLDVSNVTDMSYMFKETKLANPDVSNWDVRNATKMSLMYAYSEAANPDVSNWDVSKVEDMRAMFRKAKGLKHLDISNWNTSSLIGKEIINGGEFYTADLRLDSIELDYLNMMRKPGADSPDTKKAQENIEGFSVPKFSDNYEVETFDDEGNSISYESKNKEDKYTFKDRTHYEVRIYDLVKVSFDENYDKGQVRNKYLKRSENLVKAPKAKEREGYKFIGWNTQPDGTGEEAIIYGQHMDDVTFYAKWEKIETPPKKEIDKLYIKGYKDGSFRPSGNMTRGEVATVFSRLLEDKLDFAKVDTIYSDVSSAHWASGAIKYLSDKGIVKGNTDGNFYPDNNITRAEYATIIANMKQLTAKNSGYFTDIDNHWGKDNINAVAEAGIVNGYSDKTFKPDSFVLRAEAVKMTNGAFDRIGDRKFIDANLKEEGKFPDVDIAHWAYTDIYEAATTHEFERNNDGSEKWTNIIELGRVIGMQ